MEQNQPPSQFAQEQEQPQLTETQIIQQRVADFKVNLSPKSAQAVNGILETGLQKGQYSLQDLDMLVVIREEITRGIIDFNTTVKIAEQRLAEIAKEEQESRAEKENQVALDHQQALAEERVARKKAEQELKVLKDLYDNRVKNTTTAAVPTTGNAPSVTGETLADRQPAEPPKPTGKTSPAFAAARALNPVTATQAQIDEFRPSGTTTEEFVEEVERVNEVAIADELLELLDEPISEDKEFVEKVEETKKSFKEWTDEKITEEEELVTEEEFDAEEQAELDEAIDDEPTPTVDPNVYITQDSPVQITGGNAPNIKAQLSGDQTVTAPLDAKQFDTEEELLADMQERIDEAPAEEEYDEIVIPSSDELNRMTKAKIVEVADALNEKFNAGFNVTTEDTKAKMILDFQEQTDSLISRLQDSGEFVSAEDEGDDDTTDVRDGGYF